MTSSIAVRVSNKSTLVIRNDKTYRAVSIEELVKISNLYEDCNIVIIESISENEEEATKDFIKDFCSRSANNRVIFYIPDSSDEITSGVADELDYDICMRAEEVYSKVREELGINISPYIADRKCEKDTISDVEDIFEIKEETDKSNKETQGENSVTNEIKVDITKRESVPETIFENTVEEIDVKHTNDDNSVEDSTMEETNRNNSISQEKYEEILRDMQQATERISELEDYIQAIEDEKNTIIENYNRIVASEEVYVEDKSSGSDSRIAELEGELAKLSAERKNSLDEKNNRIKELEDEIAKLSEELNIHKEKVNELNTSMADIQNKLDTATNMIKNSGDEHATEVLNITHKIEEVKAEKAKLESEYAAIAKENSEKDSKIAELSSKLLAEIEYREATLSVMKSTLQKIKDKIEELQKVVSDNDKLRNELNDCNSTISKLNDKITEQSNMLSESASKISEYYKIIEDNRRELESKNNEISKLNSQVEKLNSIISDKNTEISLSKSSLDQNSTALAEKDVELSNKQSQIDRLVEQVNELTDSLKNKSVECAEFSRKSEMQEETIKELTEAQSGLKKRAELANNYAENEKSRMQSLVDKANARAKLLEERLKEKEEEVARIKSSPVDIENTILDINDELGTSNDTLKEKLQIYTKEIEELREQKDSLTKQLESSESENRGYKEIIKGLNSGEGTRVKPIQFSSVGTQVISVFGSGGTGVTTTAMSIASRLGAASRVLFMDLDIVTPSSDAWFRKNPFCNSIPGVNIQESTALGVLIEHGMSTFSPNMQKLISTIEVNKGGGIDYFGGVYYRPDSDKVANADFTTLFNIVGSRYNYIVIDLGRLGNSELNDSLIKAIADISFKSIVVTTQDRFEIRNFNLKLNSNKISRLNMCWLANMCANPYLDPKSQENIGNVPIACLMFDPEIRGHRESFLKTRTNKDTFEMFLKSYVFSRK